MPEHLELQIDFASVPSLNIDQYLGLWAVEESFFMGAFERVARMDLVAHVAAHPKIEAATRSSVSVDRDVAVISILGTMTKRGSSMSDAGSMTMIRRDVRNAANDPNIGGILLVIDSPGGTVSGTEDLANEIAAATKKKPVYAYLEDTTASAAMWVASQANKLYANAATAKVGSIGTFMGLYDVSGAAAAQGIKPVVIKTGAYKGAGFPGAEITSEQKADWQQLVDKTQEVFTTAIAKGRKMPIAKVRELADGRVHMAADAQQLGLIDGIQSFDKTMAELHQEIRSRGNSSGMKSENDLPEAGSLDTEVAASVDREQTTTQSREECNMSTENAPKETVAAAPVVQPAPAQPQAASYEEIVSSCPGADAAFICSQLALKATASDATKAWMAEQNARIAAANQKAEQAAASASKPGVEPLSSTNSVQASGSEDVVAQWKSAIDAKVATGVPKHRAVTAVAKENPDLHQSYVAACNAGRRKAS